MTMDEAGLRRLIRRGEGSKLDFKGCLDLATRNAKAEFVRDVLCIVNPPGPVGYLLFGVDDEGKPTGQLRDTPTEEQIQQVIREYTEPYVDTSYEIVSVGGVPVGLLTITRQPERLPYRVARPVGGDDKAIRKDDVFYRYGRHCVKAHYTEMSDLWKEGERARRRSAAPPVADPSLDPWRFLPARERGASMERTLKTVLPTLAPLTHDVVDARRPRDKPRFASALADIAGKRFLTFWYVWPRDLSTRNLGFESHWTTDQVNRRSGSRLTAASRMKFVLAYGNVTRSLVPPLGLYHRDTVLVNERFGAYLGPSPSDALEDVPSRQRLGLLEPSVYVKNVKSDALMEAAIRQCLDWVAQNSRYIPDLPFPLR
jgi:hypothetical protein